MALFEEKKVEASGIYEQRKLDEMTPEVGTSIAFYLAETPTLTGDDGEFMVCNGLLIDLKAASFDELVEKAEPVSFIPRSILEEAITDGAWNIGQVARLENKIRRGDTYKGKKVRYYAWDIYIQNVPNDVLKQLKDKLAVLKNKKPAEVGETAAESNVKEEPKTKPKL